MTTAEEMLGALYGLRWLSTARDGRQYAALHLDGCLVQPRGDRWVWNPGDQWYELTQAQLDEAAALPTPDNLPVLPEHQALRPEEETVGQSWAPVDLTEAIRRVYHGDGHRPQPTLCQLTDGTALLYTGRVNALWGESGSGKSFIAHHACWQEIRAGHHVVYVDIEDDEDGTVTRLRDIGLDETEVRTYFHYIHPHEKYGPAAQAQLVQAVRDWQPTLCVIDSTGESLALDGVKPNEDDLVASWHQRFPRAIAELGPAVCLLDHVTKDRETRGLYAIGSQRKRAAINGAAYMVEQVRPFTRDQPGACKLTAAKDRHGNYPRGHTVGEFHLDPTTGPYTVELRPNPTGVDFRPTALMQKVSDFIERSPGVSKNAIEQQKLGRRAEHVRLATQLLIDEGYVRAEQAGRAVHHHTVRPYREHLDPTRRTNETA